MSQYPHTPAGPPAGGQPSGDERFQPTVRTSSSQECRTSRSLSRTSPSTRARRSALPRSTIR